MVRRWQNDGKKINSNITVTSKSFEYNTKIIGKIPDDNNILDAEIILVKYLSNFQRFLDLPFINREIELYLSWSKECIASEISKTPEVRENKPVAAIQAIGTTFQITNNEC